MTDKCTQLQAILFDWAGTTVDYGSRAPACVFQEIFARRGVPITEAQAREPMGMAKREHIEAIAAMEAVDAAWKEKHGTGTTEEDIDGMYADFLPLQMETLGQHCDLIPGVVEAVEGCRNLGLKIASSTGYTHELMDIVVPAAEKQGYRPDCVLCSGDTPVGRPAPFLLHEAAKQFGVYPMWRFIKVDDTPVGVEAGRNAGCWSIGITRSGNCVGKSQEELGAMSPAEVESLCKNAEDRLRAAGAHYILESAADILPLVKEIEAKLAAGERPQFL